jgi:hypothetical protein
MNDHVNNVQYDIAPVLLESSKGQKVLEHAIYSRSAEKRQINENFPDIDDFGTSYSLFI